MVVFSGSVALLADTIHNIADAGTAIPLWIAFALARRKPTPTFTYGYGRVEDFAGLAIVLIILFSALVAGYEAIDRLFHPRTVLHLGWLALAGLIGFLGNEAVAVFRIKVGRRINSAANKARDPSYANNLTMLRADYDRLVPCVAASCCLVILIKLAIGAIHERPFVAW